MGRLRRSELQVAPLRPGTATSTSLDSWPETDGAILAGEWQGALAMTPAMGQDCHSASQQWPTPDEPEGPPNRKISVGTERTCESPGWERVWAAIRISVPLVADSGHLQYSSYRINIFPSALHNILRMGNFILGFRSPVRSYRIYCANRQWVSSGRELVTRAPMQPCHVPIRAPPWGVLGAMLRLWFGYWLTIKFEGVQRALLLSSRSLAVKPSDDFRERDK